MINKEERLMPQATTEEKDDTRRLGLAVEDGVRLELLTLSEVPCNSLDI